MASPRKPALANIASRAGLAHLSNGLCLSYVVILNCFAVVTATYSDARFVNVVLGVGAWSRQSIWRLNRELELVMRVLDRLAVMTVFKLLA